jgi:hypothetical protein
VNSEEKSPGTHEIPLSEMIQTLRKELRDSIDSSGDEGLRFRVESIELDLNVTVASSTEGGGGVKFWVLNADAKRKVSSDNVHTFKLKLQPVVPQGGDVLVSDHIKDLPKPASRGG